MPRKNDNQQELFEPQSTRSILDKLFEESRLYQKSKDYKDLLDFVIRLRNFAPFNAMLLQVQKPGLSFAASVSDWENNFRRRPVEGSRPLLILRPFGPVGLVYDVVDTEGDPLPEDVQAFTAIGEINEERIMSFRPMVEKNNIIWSWMDAGDNSAGYIRVKSRSSSEKGTTVYKMLINKNHQPAVQFATLVHELGHVFLGHLGQDKDLQIPARSHVGHDQMELEAESVAYIICEKNGINSKSSKYLSNFVTNNESVESVDIYRVMRAAGQVESLLELSSH